MINQIIRCLFRLSVILILASTTLVGYWLFLDNPKVVNVVSNKILNANDIHVGGTILVHVKACVLLPTIANSGERLIKNSFIFVINDISTQEGCFERTRPYPVPLDAHVGRHTYVFCASYQINPIKVVRRCNQELVFNVLPAEPDREKGDKGDKGDIGPRGMPGLNAR